MKFLLGACIQVPQHDWAEEEGTALPLMHHFTTTCSNTPKVAALSKQHNSTDRMGILKENKEILSDVPTLST